MSQFRTTELSDPTFESNGLRFITVHSTNLNGRGDICLFVPKVITQDMPIYILLHGVYGSAWAWAFKGGVHVLAKRLMDDRIISPAIIAMPSDGLWQDGSGYLAHNTCRFDDWIVSDVPKAIIENIPEATSQSPLCIGGLSMGGYGALRLGVKNAAIFTAASGHSSITKLEQMTQFVRTSIDEFKAHNLDLDIIDCIQKHKDNLPAIRFDCGTEDTLIDANRLLHRQLKALRVEHEYQEFSGGHDWRYWNEHVAKSLMFFDINV